VKAQSAADETLRRKGTDKAPQIALQPVTSVRRAFFIDVRVRVGQGRAVVLATTSVHAKMRDSNTVNDFLAIATIIYEQRDGRWLMVHQHVSQPPA
jgi:ketosteroid isomerase-like protein